MAFEELKERQRAAWGAAPFEKVEESIADMHEELVQKLEPAPGARWLDLGCGTGGVSMPAARRGAEVTGLDLSDRLVDTARRRAEEEGLSIRYDVGDCEQLPYDDAGFDIVSSSVGVMFAPDQTATASELGRVVRPGGRVGLTTWRPDSRVGDFFRMLGAYQQPLPDGAGNPLDWGSEDHVSALLGDAFELGFHDGDTPLTGESGQAVWNRFLSGFGPLKTLHDRLDPERREELRASAVAFFEQDRAGDEIRQPRTYLLTLGTRR